MRALGSAIATLILPGYGQAITGRRRAAIVFAVAVPILHGLALITPWAFYLAFVVRLASAIYAAASVRRTSQLEWSAPPSLAIAGFAIVAYVGLRQFVVEGFKLPSSSMNPTLEIGDHFFVDKLTPHWRSIGRGELIVFQYPCDPSIDYLKRVVAVGGDTVEVRCNVLYVNGTPTPSTLVIPKDQYRDTNSRGGWEDRPVSRYHEALGGHDYDVFHDIQRPLRDSVGAPAGDVRDFPMRGLATTPPSCSNTESATRAPTQVRGKIVDTKQGAASCEPQRAYIVPPGTVFVMGDNRSNSSDSRVWGPVSVSAIRGRIPSIWLTTGEHGTSLGRVGRVE